VHPLTNEFVLVEDYIEGVPISTVLKVASLLTPPIHHMYDAHGAC
jgi:predicted unusual protein kinase regulating ubiquinone biosynthesis (AarF/ABC1/UbiB family)